MRQAFKKFALFFVLSLGIGAVYFLYPDWWARVKPADEIKIFVTYYKPYPTPVKGDILQPMQVGRAIENEPFLSGKLLPSDIYWLHQAAIGDDTGDNISAKNRSFDVLTAYYWVWKHYQEIGNPKYVGFFAHRKILMPDTEDCCQFDINAPDFGLTVKGLTGILSQHRVMANAWIPSVGTQYMSAFEQYRYWHYAPDLSAMVEIIRRNYPEMLGAVADVLYDVGKPYAVWNYWVMERTLAFDYFEKLFYVMKELEKERGDIIAQYDLGQRRVYGFLAERFFAIWLQYQMKTNGIEPFFAPSKLLN